MTRAGFLGAFVSAAAAAAAQTPTFSTAVQAVRVDVLVTEEGRPVVGLTPADFEVRDNGVPQDVSFVSSEKLPLNVILALDASESVHGEPLGHLRSAGRALLERLQPDDRAALITFSHEVALRQALTPELGRVGQELGRIEPTGETAVIDGTYAAVVLGDTDVGRDLVIVFSDGVDTASWLPGERVLDAARRSDVVAYAVWVRNPERPQFLRELTRLTGGSVLEVDSTRDLGGAFVRLLQEFRQRYLLNYSPQGVSSEGWHALKVTVRGHRKAMVTARAGYAAGS
jgi:Ca-activated chloride channel family protein